MPPVVVLYPIYVFRMHESEKLTSQEKMDRINAKVREQINGELAKAHQRRPEDWRPYILPSGEILPRPVGLFGAVLES